MEDATVQAPQTRPSHASILTGLYPYEHGLRDNFSPPLRPGVETLATVLQAKGYDTAAFLGGAPVAAASGLNRGFAVYDAPEPWGPWTTAYFTEAWDVGTGETSSFPTRWMSADGKTLHLVFSGDDCFSVRRADLTVAD